MFVLFNLNLFAVLLSYNHGHPSGFQIPLNMTNLGPLALSFQS